MRNNGFVKLSDEQELFVQRAIDGNNILVNACIGSGKTTAIQTLCGRLPSNQKILYLTYNKLLKVDARAKIRMRNTTVTNYHGFAYSCLNKIGVKANISQLVSVFNEKKPSIESFDVLIIDEYQDIETEFAEMLKYIKESCPNIQIIAVGDMEQKIYDKTTLNVEEFMQVFLGEHLTMEFTLCFRLSKDIAEKLGRIWGKKIVGVNNNCVVETMTQNQIVEFLAEHDPKDILCLGARNGDLSDTLNILESEYHNKFNKQTVYASISDDDSLGATSPNSSTAIFTTFDSSKGLERKICVIFDFTESYWDVRIHNPQQSYEILRNIICVAASRGKERIIFVKSDELMLSEKTLSTKVDMNLKFNTVDISGMFDFKFREDIEKCYSLLDTKPIETEDRSVIEVKNRDGMIDLSPCIGIYQEAMYFNDYQIDDDIELYVLIHNNKKSLWDEKMKGRNLENKILFLVSLETNQARYRTQVDLPFINDNSKEMLAERLSTRLEKDEKVQVECNIDFFSADGKKAFSARGFADVVKDNVVYELKFVSELSYEHFMQCACYMIALNLEKGIIWNTRDNKAFEVRIPDRKRFLDAVVNAVTKNQIKEYYSSERKSAEDKNRNNDISEYKIGSRIIHSKYGKGTIIDIMKKGFFTVIKVVFDDGHMQSFSLEVLIDSNYICIDD